MYIYLVISSVRSSKLQYQPTQKKFSIFGKLLTEKRRRFSKIYLSYGLAIIFMSVQTTVLSHLVLHTVIHFYLKSRMMHFEKFSLILEVCHLQSISIFSNLNHPCSDSFWVIATSVVFV